MSEEPLTAAQCYELERAMREDAATLPPDSPVKKALLRMAEGYRLLGDLKKSLLRRVD